MDNKPRIPRAALLSAVRRFPECELTVRRLVDSDQAFRDMCEELADAEAALSRVEQLPEHVRCTRRAEWQDLVKRLVCEIAVALREKQAAARSQIGPSSTC